MAEMGLNMPHIKIVSFFFSLLSPSECWWICSPTQSSQNVLPQCCCLFTLASLVVCRWSRPEWAHGAAVHTFGWDVTRETEKQTDTRLQNKSMSCKDNRPTQTRTFQTGIVAKELSRILSLFFAKLMFNIVHLPHKEGIISNSEQAAFLFSWFFLLLSHKNVLSWPK